MDTSPAYPWLERGRLNFSWLLKLRWAAAGGQLLAVLLVDFALGIELPLVPALAIIGILALSNLLLDVWFRREISGAAWLRWIIFRH